MNKMNKRPLFIYDWYGTVEAPLWSAYMVEQCQEKRIASANGHEYHPSQTMAEFKSQHQNQKTTLISGMAELIRFTDSIGNNILLSDGSHLDDACSELLALACHFKQWTFDGKLIKFGCKPETKSKSDPEVAEALIKQFNPSKVFVIGDSNTEAQFAEFLHADTFIFCGLDKKQITAGKTLPHVEHLVTGHPMIKYIEGHLSENQPHVISHRSQQRKQVLLGNQYVNDGE